MVSHRKADALLALGRTLGAQLRTVPSPPAELLRALDYRDRKIQLKSVELIAPRLHGRHLFLTERGLAFVRFPFILHWRPTELTLVSCSILEQLNRRQFRRIKKKLKRLRKQYHLTK